MSPQPASQAAHLHVHSEYSLLDGACKIDRMAARAAELGMPALGLTDHGVLNGAVEMYDACRSHGVKPILGMEAYLVDDLGRVEDQVRYERNHLTLLAANEDGFRNLVKLSSASYLEGFARGKANVDMELLERHADGVIALSGCLQSRFCRRLVEGRPADGAGAALGGGLFNMELKGSGWVALVSDGPPVLLELDGTETFADPQAAITWSSGLSTSVKTDVNVKTLIGRASGETIQVAFSGKGWLLIQPSEGRVAGTTGAQGGASSGLGKVLGG